MCVESLATYSCLFGIDDDSAVRRVADDRSRRFRGSDGGQAVAHRHQHRSGLHLALERSHCQDYLRQQPKGALQQADRLHLHQKQPPPAVRAPLVNSVLRR
jgi:hypothetical protein